MTPPSAPANYSLLHWSPQRHFSLRGLAPRLVVDHVYQNSLHSLLPFWVSNHTDLPLCLPTHTQGVKVQRHNANWSAIDPSARAAYVDLRGATADGEVTIVCSAVAQRSFAEPFNELEGDSCIDLAPHETAELVLLFAADGAPRREYTTHSGHITIGTGTDVCSAALRFRCCQSVLEMDPPTSRIYVDDCVIGRTYERILRVRNTSAIGLDWTMTVVETTDSASLSSLQLLGSDMLPLRGGHLGAHEDTQILVRYTAHTEGEFLSRFLVENSNDASNQRYWVFRARVSQRQEPRRVELLSAADISFGECTSGVWYSRDIELKNVSEAPALVRFRAEGNTTGLTLRTGAVQRREPQGWEGEEEHRDDDRGEDRNRDRDRGQVQTQGQDPAAQFDEVAIKPGAARTVTLRLFGATVNTTAVSAGQFERHSFTLFCETGSERLSIPCTADLCTAFVRVVPPQLDFGSVDVGTSRTLYMRIENLSRVAATVQCVLESKVINCTRAPLTVPAQQAATVRVDIYPRRVNARYRKQIIVRNAHNRLNDCVVDVRSTHVDQRRVASHNAFYQTLVAHSEQNFVDFGPVPRHTRCLRRLVLRNRCRCAISVDLTPDGASVAPLQVDDAHAVAHRLPLLERQAALHSSIERFKEHSPPAEPPSRLAADPPPYALRPDRFVGKRVERGHTCLAPFPLRRTASRVPAYLDVATDTPAATPPLAVRMLSRPSSTVAAAVASRHTQSLKTTVPSDDTVIRRARLILDEITERLDMVPQTLFASERAEDEYVRRQVDLHRYIDLLLEAGFLRPAHRVTLPPLADVAVYVMLQPGEAALQRGEAGSAEAVRLDANLHITLVDHPRDLLPFADGARAAAALAGDGLRLPVRRFLIQAAVVRSELDIGQKSINVGNMQVEEASRKYLVIQNRSETPLMYAIRKTGSIASGDIRFVDNNRYGVVRGLDSRKVVFLFSPSLNGTYNEQISIANVLDPLGGRKATLKAVVRRPSRFYIQSLRLDFDDGEILELGQRSRGIRVLGIRNMTTKARTLVVQPAAPDKPAPSGVGLEAVFPDDVAAPAAQLLDRETEEKIEALEQKLKIAVRKSRTEKVDKYRAKLAKLREVGKPDDRADGVQIKRQAGDRQLRVVVPAGGDAQIAVAVIASASTPRPPGTALTADQVVDAQGAFAVHEDKDVDGVKVVTVTGRVRLGDGEAK
ncbi:hypothetical protein GGF46_003422 [Coemansia sp. RSA 552]|nr:hypothetical protein GGF46_003422 [Coemansia sp. RSA 552]